MARSPGRPTEFPIKKLVALNQEIVDGIERFQADHLPPIDNQSAAIRWLIRDHLVGLGYLKAEPQEGTRPEDLNASNDD